MSNESFIFLMGFLVLITPLLGFPHEWKDWGIMVFGGLILIVGYRLRRKAYIRSLDTKKGERRADAFVENHSPLAETEEKGS